MRNAAFLALLVASMSTYAFAGNACSQGGEIDVYACSAAGVVGGTSVILSNTPCGYEAELSQAALGGKPQVMRSVLVKLIPVPKGMMGASQRYVGQDFSLTVHVDGTPVRGGHLADLVAEVNGQRVNEQVICTATR